MVYKGLASDVFGDISVMGLIPLILQILHDLSIL